MSQENPRRCGPIVAAAISCLTSCSLIDGSKVLETVDYPAGIHEERIEIVGKPNFRQSADCCELLIDGQGPKHVGYLLWPKRAPDPKGLDISRPWQFELLRQDGGKWRDFEGSEILKASSRGQIVFDASICEVHHLKMNRVVEVCDEYADRTKPDRFYKSRSRQFPHSGTAFPACTFYPDRELTWQCAECAKASKRWCHRHL